MNTYIKSFILWFLIALPSVCFGFHEVSPPDIMKACMGDTVSLPLNLTYDEVPPLPIDAFQFDVAYPTELLTFIGIDTSGSLTGGWTFMDGIENTPGVITLGGYSYPGQITTSGVLVFVTFSVDTTGGPLPVSVSGFTDDLAGATTTDGLLQTGVNDVSPPGMLKGCVGNTVTLPLILTYDGCPPEPIDAFQFDVTYPTTLFTFVGVDTTGSLTSGWTFMDGVENTPGVITLGGYSYPGQISSSGVLVNVIFSVTAEGGPLPVSLSQFTDDLARARTTAGLFKTSANDVSPPELTEGCPGDTVSLPLTLTYDGCPPQPIDAFQFDLTFPTTLLSFIEVDPSGSLTEGWTFIDGTENTPGVITLGGYNYPGQISTSGILVYINFKVTASGGPLPVSLDQFIDDLVGSRSTAGAFTGESDVDGDETCDDDDNCPNTANADQLDSDQDGAGDVCDVCPNDPDYDIDGDGVCGDVDNCPDVANTGQEDGDGDGTGDVCDACTDTDGDGYGNPGYPANTCTEDNCPYVSNPGQEDEDGDGIGDVCDICTDTDGDGYGNPGYPVNICSDDNCPDEANAGQENADNDGFGDICDICPYDPDNDIDNDGVCGDVDNCPEKANTNQKDSDSDGVGDMCDNCLVVPNPGQEDADGDGIGDVCDGPELIITMDAEYSRENGEKRKGDCILGGSGVVGPGDVLVIKVLVENVGYSEATGASYYSDSFEYLSLVVGSVTTTEGSVMQGNTPGDAAVEVDVGTIPGGGTVEITYQVAIDDPLPPDVTVIIHQGTVNSNEFGSTLAECIHTFDGIVRIYIGEPIVSVFISPELSIVKPDSQFQVCIEVDSATAEMWINSVYALITFNSILLDSVKVPTFEGTLLDSSGWDMKWHYYPGPTDTLELWLIGGGVGNTGVTGSGPIVCWEFRVRDDIYGTMPGDTTSIRFSKFWFNEGQPMSETENGFFMVNREPEFVTLLPDTIHIAEMHELCLDIEAVDPDPDSMFLWLELDPYPCDGAQPDTAYGRGSVSLEWCWTPPKMGACDTLACSLFVKSTMPDSLM
ncbi:MAG: thrombospondin type 3 repeat-containing protein, partial [Gemmatimonadota bacterium]